jgi:5-methylcytosine-specific restriction endonuclease McrA
MMTVFSIKAAVRARDGNRCTGCGIGEADHRQIHGRGLEVHRTAPGSAYSVDGCVTLCRTCHGQMPKRPRDTVHERVNIRSQFVGPGQQLADKLGISFCELVNLSLREELEAHGLWPPPPPPPGNGTRKPKPE